MKTLLSLLTLFWSLASFSIIHAAEVPPLRVLPLGDSLTVGYTVPSGYRDLLQALLADAGYNFDFLGTQIDQLNTLIPDPDHEGHSGWRIDEIHTNVNGWLNAIATPDVILLLIGTNDIHQNYNVPTAPQRLENLVSTIATARPTSKILLANLLIRTDDAAKNAQHTTFNTFVPGIVSNQVSLGREVYFVDLHSRVSSSGLSSDGLHPNQSGYDDIAEGWFDRIATVAPPSSIPPSLTSAASLDFTRVALTFNKPVADTAATPANYSINGSVTVQQAELEPLLKRTVTLTTSPLAQDTDYIVTVNNIIDRTDDENEIAPNSTASFATALLANGSFETGISGWNFSGNVNVANFSPYQPTDGSHVVVYNWGQSTPNGVVTQTFPTVSGQTYAVQFDYGTMASNKQTQRIQVSATGSSALPSETYSVVGLGGSASIRWQTGTYAFTANSTATTLSFRDVSPATLNLDLMLDHIRVSTQATHTVTVTSANGALVNVAVTPLDNNGAGNGTTNFTRTYNSGTSVTLTAPATSSAGTFEKWQRNGADLTTSTTANFTLDANATLHAIYVAGAPVIAQQPANLTSSVGGSATFSVTATGAGPLTYQWQFNGADIAGATANSLVISNLDANDAGNYRVVVSNSTADVTSATAALTVIASGTIANGSLESGSTGWSTSGNLAIADFSPYQPTHGSSVVVFNWGQSPPNGIIAQTFATTPGQTYSLQFDVGAMASNKLEQRLKVTAVGATTLLDQTVSVFGLGGSATSHWIASTHSFTADSISTTVTFRDVSPVTNNIDLMLDHVRVTPSISRVLTVNSSPNANVAITVSPADLDGDANGTTGFARTYPHGTAVNLTAPLFAGGLQFIQWQRDGQDFGSARAISITLNADETFTAIYGEAPPVITQQPASVTAAPGTTATFTVTAAASGTLTYQWKRGSSSISGATGSTYTIPDVEFSDAGDYSVVVTSNGLAVTSATASLTVVEGGTLANGSFESGTAGWTVSGNYGIANFAPYVPTDGTSVIVFNWGQSTPNAVISQTFATAPGQTYSLRFDLGAMASNKSTQRVQVTVAGTTTLLSQQISIVGLGGTTSVRWTPISYTFTADSASTTLTFQDISPSTTNIDLMLDRVHVAAYSIDPEPFANGDFETADATWSTSGNLNFADFPPYVPGGDNTVVVFNWGQTTPNGEISQLFTTVSGQTYDLVFDLGAMASNYSEQRVQVRAQGATTRLNETVSVFGIGGTATTNWETAAFAFTADSATTTLSFRDISPTSHNIDLMLDNVSVTP